MKETFDEIKKAIRKFKFEMLEADDYDESSKNAFYLGIKDRFIGCLCEPVSQADSNFLIDIDNPDMLDEAKIVLAELKVKILLEYKTKNGFHLITEPFNPNMFVAKDCEVKKNALMLLSY